MLHKKIYRLVHRAVGLEFLSIDIDIKLNHFQTLVIGGITVNKDGSIWIYNMEQWFPLEETDKNYNIISKTIYNHLKTSHANSSNKQQHTQGVNTSR